MRQHSGQLYPNSTHGDSTRRTTQSPAGMSSGSQIIDSSHNEPHFDREDHPTQKVEFFRNARNVEMKDSPALIVKFFTG